MRSFSERGVPLEEHGPSGSIDATADRNNTRALFALTRHRSFSDMARAPRTGRVTDGIIANFNAMELPWFEGAFTNSVRLPARCEGPPHVTLFEGVSRPSFAKTWIN